MSGKSGARVDGSSPSEVVVYFDGACPLCRREIRFFRERALSPGIQFFDVAACKTEQLSTDLDRGQAMARFHVRLPDGNLESGARAFGVLWSATPGLRWLGWLARAPLSTPVFEAAYRLFLVVRPIMQWIARHLEPARARDSGRTRD